MNPLAYALNAHRFSAVCAVLNGTQNFTKIWKEIYCDYVAWGFHFVLTRSLITLKESFNKCVWVYM